MPERRELEYYLDVADAIKEKYDSFYGAGIIGAPVDFTVLHKYREAGFSNISHNMEAWDKNLFVAISPGKEKRNGGWQHWVDSLEYAVDSAFSTRKKKGTALLRLPGTGICWTGRPISSGATSGPASGPHAGQVFQIKNGEFEGDKLSQWKYPSHRLMPVRYSPPPRPWQT